MKYFLCIFLFISSAIFSKEHKDNLYICAIYQNEARFLNEWVEFHLQQGVDKIYLYNNKSEDDYMRPLYRYIRSGHVVFRQWPYDNDSVHAWNATQCAAYMDCIERVKDRVKWVAFIDTDEFLFNPSGHPLPYILKHYDGIDAIGVNWVCYGSNNIEYLGDGWLTRNMTMRSEYTNLVNTHVKSIVRPEKVTGCINPHFFLRVPGSVMTNEKKDPMEGPFHENSVDFLRINHYWSHDLKFLREEKIKRQIKWLGHDQGIHERDASYNVVYDPYISKQL